VIKPVQRTIKTQVDPTDWDSDFQHVLIRDHLKQPPGKYALWDETVLVSSIKVRDENGRTTAWIPLNLENSEEVIAALQVAVDNYRRRHGFALTVNMVSKDDFPETVEYVSFQETVPQGATSSAEVQAKPKATPKPRDPGKDGPVPHTTDEADYSRYEDDMQGEFVRFVMRRYDAGLPVSEIKKELAKVRDYVIAPGVYERRVGGKPNMNHVGDRMRELILQNELLAAEGKPVPVCVFDRVADVVRYVRKIKSLVDDYGPTSERHANKVF
jgi:hypothetical protein